MLNLLILKLLLVFFILFLPALLLGNSRYYSGLLWSYKHLSVCPHLLLTVFCPGASSEPCPESWRRLKASSWLPECGKLCPLSTRFQPV